MTPDHDAWLEALVLRERAKGLRFVTEAADKVWAELFPTRVCGKRTDSPGFFTSCSTRETKYSCMCSAQVREDLADDPYAYATAEYVEAPIREQEVA